MVIVLSVSHFYRLDIAAGMAPTVVLTRPFMRDQGRSSPNLRGYFDPMTAGSVKSNVNVTYEMLLKINNNKEVTYIYE